MAMLYLAGPIDYGGDNSKDRQAFVAAASVHAVVYDATGVFSAPSVDDMTAADVAGAVRIHHAAIHEASLFVADMRHRSVGTPIEMWLAYSQDIPVYTLYDRSLPKSLYVERCSETVVYSWQDMLSVVLTELKDPYL